MWPTAVMKTKARHCCSGWVSFNFMSRRSTSFKTELLLERTDDACSNGIKSNDHLHTCFCSWDNSCLQNMQYVCLATSGLDRLSVPLYAPCLLPHSKAFLKKIFKHVAIFHHQVSRLKDDFSLKDFLYGSLSSMIISSSLSTLVVLSLEKSAYNLQHKRKPLCFLFFLRTGGCGKSQILKYLNS